jgi:hypothetical protein
MPAMEIGWLRPDAQGSGYATDAPRQMTALPFGMRMLNGSKSAAMRPTIAVPRCRAGWEYVHEATLRAARRVSAARSATHCCCHDAGRL